MASPAKGKAHRDQSPFCSSPYANLLASPIAARRSTMEERRRPAGKYAQHLSPGPTDYREEESEELEGVQEENEDEDDDEDEDEDDENAGESSPLLPIFSAEHLGIQYAWQSQ